MKNKKYAVGYNECGPDSQLCIYDEAEFDRKPDAYVWAIKEGCGPEGQPLCICEFDRTDKNGLVYYTILEERKFDDGKPISIPLF